jgi:hypothetical protein
MRLAGHVAILVGKLEEKWQSGRSIRRWEVRDIGCDDLGWFKLAQNKINCWAL